MSKELSSTERKSQNEQQLSIVTSPLVAIPIKHPMTSRPKVASKHRRPRARKFLELGYLFDFLGVALGVLGKVVFDTYLVNQELPLSFVQVLLALSLGLVVYPTLYHSQKDLVQNLPWTVRFASAFQMGFFFQTILGDVGNGFSLPNI